MIRAEVVEAVAAFLGVNGDVGERDEVPPMWHGFFLPDLWRRDELGPDGHAHRGVPAPPAPAMRRMFGGGRTVHHAQLRVEKVATRTSTVVARTEKQGRSGRLTFVTVRHELTQSGQLVVVDEQDVVYLAAPDRPVQASARGDGGISEGLLPAGERWSFPVDNVTLFRFSALTANAHRIHYDQAYAASEGHSDVVVHGPLQILLMAEAHRHSGETLVGRTFEYRLVAPATGPQVLEVIRRNSSPDGQVPVVEVYGNARQLIATSRLSPA